MEAKSETNKSIPSKVAAVKGLRRAYTSEYDSSAAPPAHMINRKLDFFGMDYKVATTIMQIFGYLISKFFAIKIVSELKREDRLKFMVCSVALAELALVFFGLLPTCIPMPVR